MTLHPIPPITVRPVTPLSRDEWEASYQIGALLAGPFDAEDPQVARRVADYYGEATAENIAAFLHDETVACCECGSRWLADEADAPAFELADGFACEQCAESVETEPTYASQNRRAGGWRVSL